VAGTGSGPAGGAGGTRAGPRTRPAAVGLGLLAVALGAAGPVTSALTAVAWERLVDLEVYREAGRSVLLGRPVYEQLTPVPNLLPFTYPPPAAVAAVPLALVPARVVEVAWTLGQVAVLAWVVAVAFRPLLRRCGAAAPVALGALTGACGWLVPVRDGLRFGQVDLLLVALCLAGCARAGAARRGQGGVPVGVAAALKLTPAVFVVHLWLAGRRRAAAVAAGTAALLFTAAAVALPRDSRAYWTGAILDSDRLGANAGTSNQSLRGVLLRVGPDGAAGTLLWVALVTAVAAYGFPAAAAAARRGEDVRAVAIVGLLAVLLSPVGWIHHLAWVVVALGALLGAGHARGQWLRAGAVAAFFAVPLPWVGVTLLGGAAPYWVGRTLQQSYAVGALVLLVLLAGRPGARLRSPPRLPAR
jgi:alpha-1,2-mannosyltransferase